MTIHQQKRKKEKNAKEDKLGAPPGGIENAKKKDRPDH